MKKLTKAVLAVVVVVAPSLSFAWEAPQNPDRFPSIGLTYTGIAEDGQYKALGFTQDVEARTGALVLDTRLPLSNSFTLNLGLGATGTHTKGDANAVFAADKLDTTGGLFTIGARYYFNH